MESKCGSKETCQEAVALRLMVAWTMVVAVEMNRIVRNSVEARKHPGLKIVLQTGFSGSRC